MREYAFYRGDEFVDIGTYKELSKKLGIKIETLQFYATSTYRKRMEKRGAINYRIMVPLDDIEE
ncbi:MAG: hypothetical protein ACRC2K_13210 [Clostridium sp.]